MYDLFAYCYIGYYLLINCFSLLHYGMHCCCNVYNLQESTTALATDYMCSSCTTTELLWCWNVNTDTSSFFFFFFLLFSGLTPTESVAVFVTCSPPVLPFLTGTTLVLRKGLKSPCCGSGVSNNLTYKRTIYNGQKRPEITLLWVRSIKQSNLQTNYI